MHRPRRSRRTLRRLGAAATCTALLATGLFAVVGAQAASAAGGGLDLIGYCQSIGQSTATITGPVIAPGAANTWVCVDAQGNKSALNLQAACDWEYPGQGTTLYVPDPNNAFSPVCNPPTHTVTGTVTMKTTGAPVGGVTISAGASTTLTKPDGTYTLTVTDGVYTVTPTGLGYSYTPTSVSEDLRHADQNASFVATRDVTVTAVTVTGSTGPASGPVGGGTAITITGTGFGNPGDADTVNLASVGSGSLLPATQVVVKNATTSLPAGQASLTTDVEVTAGGQVSRVNAPADQFSYQAVTINSISPASVSPAGGTPMTIGGSGFGGSSNDVVVVFCPAGSTNAVAAGCVQATNKAGSPAYPPSSDTTITGVIAPPFAISQPTETVAVFVQVFPPGGGLEVGVSAPFPYTEGVTAPPCGALSSCQGATGSNPNGSVVATSTTATGSITATGAAVGGITVGRYPSNPVGAPTFTAAGSFFDVKVSNPNSFTSVTIQDCDLLGGTSARWWNPAANSGIGAWQTVTPATLAAGPPACLTISLNSTSSPTLAQLTGTVFATAINPPTAAADHYVTPIGAKLTVGAANGVLANDTRNGATIVAHTNPTHGTLALAGDGSFTYNPTRWFIGIDTFTYTLHNPAGSSTATVTIDVGARADLSVTVSAPTQTLPGSSFTYTVTVTNTGPDTVSGITTWLFLPPEVSITSVSPHPSTQLGALIAWSGASLAPATSITYTVTVKVNTKPPLTLTAVTVTGALGSIDPNLANNTAAATTKT